MTPSPRPSVRILQGDVRNTLASLPDGSAHCAVTSPPYFALRDYGVEGQIGLEATPDEYIGEMVGVMREVRRVLRDDGTLWLNIGDSYSGSGKGGNPEDSPHVKQRTNGGTLVARKGDRAETYGVKAKDLLGIPWMLAFALRADGWYLRSEIIWHKPAPMPESVRDRPTKAHEQIFLLAKRAKYYYDSEAISEPLAYPDETRRPLGSKGAWEIDGREQRENGGGSPYDGYPSTRNARSVWTIGPSPFPEAHFATFPPALPEKCIRAGTSERGCCAECGAPWVRILERGELRQLGHGTSRKAVEMLDGGVASSGMLTNQTRESRTLGWEPTCKCAAAVVPCTVLDPFFGAGTTGLVAQRLGRNCIGCELNGTYAEMARKRIHDDAPLLANVSLEAA